MDNFFPLINVKQVGRKKGDSFIPPPPNPNPPPTPPPGRGTAACAPAAWPEPLAPVLQPRF